MFSVFVCRTHARSGTHYESWQLDEMTTVDTDQLSNYTTKESGHV